jgi:formylglycine-generating enzyme required for sulfatase activity
MYGRPYIAWLKDRSGKAYRLLSEAEWEYCCRAGTESAYSTGDSITPAQANFGMNADGTTPVSKFPRNVFGLHDMHGNVWEWCEIVGTEIITAIRRRAVRSGWEIRFFAFGAGVRGSSILTASARPPASGGLPATASSVWVSALPERFNLLQPPSSSSLRF